MIIDDPIDANIASTILQLKSKPLFCMGNETQLRPKRVYLEPLGSMESIEQEIPMLAEVKPMTTVRKSMQSQLANRIKKRASKKVKPTMRYSLQRHWDNDSSDEMLLIEQATSSSLGSITATKKSAHNNVRRRCRRRGALGYQQLITCADTRGSGKAQTPHNVSVARPRATGDCDAVSEMSDLISSMKIELRHNSSIKRRIAHPLSRRQRD